MAECYIWNTPATYPQDSTGDYVYLDSPRAGGKYRITGTAASTIANLNETQKARLTTWLCRQRRAGIEYPSISSDIVTLAKSMSAMQTAERIDRLLLYFNEFGIGHRVIVWNSDQFDPRESEAFRLTAETECKSKSELDSLLQLAVGTTWLATPVQNVGATQYTPSVGGWLRIDTLVLTLPLSTQAFVAMWFNDATHAAYESGIAPAIKDAGYEAVRIDKKEHANKIDDEIIAEIRRSKFLVADFTCEPKQVRGGVYFEAGFAMGLGIPVIWTCAKSSFDDVHFDTRQYNHIFWETPEALRSQLANRIGAVIGDGPLKTG